MCPPPAFSSVILSIAHDPAVVETRRLVLEQRGFAVAIATNFVEIEQKCRQRNIACIVIGMDIEPSIKRTIGNLLTNACPQLPLLEICRTAPEIEGASAVHSDAPEDLLAAIDDLLKPSGRRYTEQLYRRAKATRKKAAEASALAREMRARIREMRANYPKFDYSRGKKPAAPSPLFSPKTPRDSSQSS